MISEVKKNTCRVMFLKVYYKIYVPMKDIYKDILLFLDTLS